MVMLKNQKPKGKFGGYPGKTTNRELQEARVDLIAKYLREHPIASRFDINRKFCKKFNLTWQWVQELTSRARKQLEKEARISPEKCRQMGVNTLTKLIDSKSEMIRIKAERSLAAIMGYDMPTQTRIGNPDGSPLPATIIAPIVNFVLPAKKEHPDGSIEIEGNGNGNGHKEIEGK